MAMAAAVESERAQRTRWLVILLAALGGVVLVHVTWMTFHFGGPRATSVVDDLPQVGAAALAAVLAGTRVRARPDRSTRLGWIFMSASCAVWAFGMAVYSYFEVVLGTQAPFPSLADVGFLGGTALVLPAVILLGGWALSSSRLRRLLDGGIVASTVLLVSWLTVMRTVHDAGGSDPFSFALSLAYPVGDVVTIVILLSTLSQSRRLDLPLLLVAVGILAFALSDGAYAYLLVVNSYHSASVIDAGWVAGYLLIGVASQVGPAARRGDGPGQLARWQVALPYVPLMLAGLLILAQVVRRQPLDPFAEAVMAVVVVLVLVRQLMAVVESQSLTSRLNETLSVLKRTSAEREILIEQAPVGICRLDREGRLLAVNLTLQRMLGRSMQELRGRRFPDIVHPDDRERDEAGFRTLAEGRLEAVRTESRLVRADGTGLWCSRVASAVRDHDGGVEGFITIVEDVSEGKRQAERAAHIQRHLLPQTVLAIDGYELAAACRPAEDVAGDFYDWVVAPDGCIDLAVADVMGKGVPAALVMAVLRTAIRSAPRALPPAARVRVAAESITHGLGDEGLFVTLFLARLDTATGLLRYVDAGHGYCVVRRLDGELVHLSSRSLPVGVLDEGAFDEGSARLKPGEALVVYSDGLVEREERTLPLSEYARELESENAESIVRRLMERMPQRPADDVTVMVLRRLTGAEERREAALATAQ